MPTMPQQQRLRPRSLTRCFRTLPKHTVIRQASITRVARLGVAVEKAREQVANAIGASPKEIYFTGSGSEADNWALRSTARALCEKG